MPAALLPTKTCLPRLVPRLLKSWLLARRYNDQLLECGVRYFDALVRTENLHVTGLALASDDHGSADHRYRGVALIGLNTKRGLVAALRFPGPRIFRWHEKVWWRASRTPG
jgi:hypothetical protein